MARLMIFVQRPRHVSAEEAEDWLRRELEPVAGDGVRSVELRRLASPGLRFSDTWSWMVELDCRDADAARRALEEGPGLMLLADLRLLGMRPSLALVEDGD
jgi:hypothetical protein